MQIHLIIAGIAGVAAFLCLIMAMAHETHTIPTRRSKLNRSVMWSLGALGLMLLSLGAFAAGA
jgi:uncharacterized membrane protein